MTTSSSLYRLLAWLSPSFPVGAFSYSHGLEFAVEIELIKNRDDLVAWCATLLRHGSGLSDAMLFAAAWRALDANDHALLMEIFELSSAMRPTSELAQETQAQGAAFARAIFDAWPHPVLDKPSLQPDYATPSYPLSVALCAHAHGIDMRDALAAYLHAFTANLISSGVRLIPLGQTDGQIALRLLEADVAATADMAQILPLEEIGSATPMLDYCSARHETQYTRLFRS
ncbi:MAG: urease accessory protein UreF [Pseudomonadota bacterium]